MNFYIQLEKSFKRNMVVSYRTKKQDIDVKMLTERVLNHQSMSKKFLSKIWRNEKSYLERALVISKNKNREVEPLRNIQSSIQFPQWIFREQTR